jgi:exonuclease SbcC
MTTIEYIYVEGFGSVVEEVKYKFNRVGLNLILGVNGVGKTTLFNALSWCLYKQVLKKGSGIEPWPHVLDKSYKGTKVRVVIKKDNSTFEVIRCQGYKGKIFNKAGGNRLILIKDGKEREKLRDKSDINKEIQNLVGYSFDLFKSTVLLGQELKVLMQEDGPNKKKVFDEAFETTFIIRAKDIVDKRLGQKTTDLLRLDTKLEINKTHIASHKAQVTQIKDAHKSYQERIDRDKVEVQGQINSLVDEIALLAKKINSKANNRIRQDLRQEVELLESQKQPNTEFEAYLDKNRCESKIEELEISINNLKNDLLNVPKKCKACGQDIPKEKVKEYQKTIKEKLDAKKAERDKLQKRLPGLIKAHKQAKANVAINEEISKKVDELKSKLKNLDYQEELDKDRITDKEAEIKRLKKRLNKLNEEKPPQNTINALVEQLGILKQDKNKLKEEYRTLKKSIAIDNWLIKDPLSNAGLKAYIFDDMLTKVNNHLKAYKQIIGFGINVYVEMESARKDIKISIFRNNNEVPYEDLSKGQKQLVHVTLAFALYDTVFDVKPINILLMDEVFESLSEENLEAVGNIVQKKATNKCVHLITHQKSFNPINCYKTYLTLKEPGHTVIHTKYRES